MTGQTLTDILRVQVSKDTFLNPNRFILFQVGLRDSNAPSENFSRKLGTTQLVKSGFVPKRMMELASDDI